MSSYSRKKIDAGIRQTHRLIESRIEERLAEFRRVWETGDDMALFMELAFCLLTPGTRPQMAELALGRLADTGLLLSGGIDEISPLLNIVRFRNNKARNLVEARDMFCTRASLRTFLGGFGDAFSMREALVREVRGIGHKEASHYLRNIGLGEDLAILDRHVLRVMSGLGLAGRGGRPAAGTAVPAAIGSPRRYRDLEDRLRHYASGAGVPMGHLDMVIIFMATGTIFK